MQNYKWKSKKTGKIGIWKCVRGKTAIEQAKLEKQGSSTSTSQFDATKNIRLVPKFVEKEVDKYFLHFEKIANSLKWPKVSWPLLLQSVFIGKAREIYSFLSIEQCHDYDLVKKAVLKAYELVPEAYRQKFRSAKKETNQTQVKFARVQEQMFYGWLSSNTINDSDMLSYSLTTMRCFLTKEWCGFPAYC